MASRPLPQGERGGASLRCLHLVEGEDEVLLVERLVAGEAGFEVGLVVDGLVRLERLILPLAVAYIVGVLGAPAVALLHHHVADDWALDEAAVGVLLRLTGGR